MLAKAKTTGAGVENMKTSANPNNFINKAFLAI